MGYHLLYAACAYHLPCFVRLVCRRHSSRATLDCMPSDMLHTYSIVRAAHARNTGCFKTVLCATCPVSIFIVYILRHRSCSLNKDSRAVTAVSSTIYYFIAFRPHELQGHRNDILRHPSDITSDHSSLGVLVHKFTAASTPSRKKNIPIFTSICRYMHIMIA